MTSSLKTILLAGTAALAVALGAIAAHAGGYEDLLIAQQAGAALADAADSDSDPIIEAVEAAVTEMAVEVSARRRLRRLSAPSQVPVRTIASPVRSGRAPALQLPPAGGQLFCDATDQISSASLTCMTIGALWCCVIAPMKLPRRCTSLPISERSVSCMPSSSEVDVDFRAGRDVVAVLGALKAHDFWQLEDDRVVALDQTTSRDQARHAAAAQRGDRTLSQLRLSARRAVCRSSL